MHEFACAGRCSACVKGKRSVQYCRLIKEHDDDKSGLCVNCYKAKLDQSVTQCRQVLGHKSRDVLGTFVMMTYAAFTRYFTRSFQKIQSLSTGGAHSRLLVHIASPTSPPYVGTQLIALFHTQPPLKCSFYGIAA